MSHHLLQFAFFTGVGCFFLVQLVTVFDAFKSYARLFNKNVEVCCQIFDGHGCFSRERTRWMCAAYALIVLPATRAISERRRRSGGSSWCDLQVVFREFDDFCEACFIVKCDICEDFAVELDACFAQTVRQAAVGQTVCTRGGVDTGDPESSERALALFTTDVLVAKRLEYGVTGGTVERTTITAEAFGQFQNFVTTTTSGKSATNTCHGASPLGANAGAATPTSVPASAGVGQSILP